MTKKEHKEQLRIAKNLLVRHQERLQNLRQYFYHINNYADGFELGYRNTLAGKTKAGRKLGKREAAKLEKQFINSLEATWRLPLFIKEAEKELAE
tara:strand:+ start:838 stop:1122 length:285 start_codon:yes stop_codon:yes gene_type:complete